MERKEYLKDDLEESVYFLEEKIRDLTMIRDELNSFFDLDDEVSDVDILIEKLEEKLEEIKPLYEEQERQEAEEINKEYMKSCYLG